MQKMRNSGKSGFETEHFESNVATCNLPIFVHMQKRPKTA